MGLKQQPLVIMFLFALKVLIHVFPRDCWYMVQRLSLFHLRKWRKSRANCQPINDVNSYHDFHMDLKDYDSWQAFGVHEVRFLMLQSLLWDGYETCPAIW